jgi:hypothetical protein
LVGDAVVTDEAFCARVALGFADGEGLGDPNGVAVGLEPALVLVEEVRLDPGLAALVLAEATDAERDPVELAFRPVELAFRFAGVVGVEPRRLLLEFEFVLLLLDLRLGFVSTLGRERFVFVFAVAVLPPGTVNTTSSPLARCSTWAVVPGCKRKDTTVLSPVFCVFTSVNPRPRVASALGTSAVGILR